MQLTGIILAGGKSSRMGKDKALLELKEQTLLQRAIHFCQSFCDEILISSNSLEHEVEGIQIVSDEISDCGPIGGIYSCLKKSKNDWNFVISVDAPFVEMDFVSFLVAQKDSFDAVVPVHKNGREPLIALYHKKLLPVIETRLITGDYKMQFLLQKVHTNYIDAKGWIKKYPRLFFNINYPEDLKTEKEN
ncbi:NTP transferase domain-containing protein [Maribellus comscasis]|uniref:Probable molybdenum cofactor guanylyltransferase n=1 Tax=Maribellus comscasis TaxID=2681766 RepID=A0A6I6JT09_9BACT|nr:molybdenum cofactor guanylyltransferase [Maribellus comscasis]QGY43282.1 NTP transferase domain-containing protein [Maribellus comscasis]